MSKQCPNKALVDAENKPLHKYDFYCRLKTTEAWKVPIIYGFLPRAVDASSTPKEKADYAFAEMLLFRPHRSLDDFVSNILN